MLTAKIVHQPEFFNVVAQATIPESYAIFFSDRRPKWLVDSMEEALEVCAAEGARVKSC